MSDEPELISLDEAAKKLGFTKLYVRTLVRRGKLKTKKVPIGPESSVWKHMLLVSDIEKFAVKTGSRANSRRQDGRNKYVLYASLKELARVKEVLSGIEDLKAVAELIAKPPQASGYQRRKKKAFAKLKEEAK